MQAIRNLDCQIVDMKPNNILLGRDLLPKIIDLGMAAKIGKDVHYTDLTDYYYMAPELEHKIHSVSQTYSMCIYYITGVYIGQVFQVFSLPCS